MNWLTRLFGKKPQLSPEQTQWLAAWQALPAADLGAASDASRFVVVDVETSGLNMRTDRLIAIGAVAVDAGAVRLADSMEVVLQQSRISDRENILIHGISGTAQAEGVPPVEALLSFLEFLGNSPLVAFHVAFDKTMIDRALKTWLGLNFKHAWADLAYICPALFPELARSHRSLDNWMQRFEISNFARHSALADAVSTAELLLALREPLQAKRILSFRDMQSLQSAQQITQWTS